MGKLKQLYSIVTIEYTLFTMLYISTALYLNTSVFLKRYYYDWGLNVHVTAVILATIVLLFTHKARPQEKLIKYFIYATILQYFAVAVIRYS